MKINRIVEEKRFPAIRIVQAPEKPLYLAAIDAKEIRNQANINRLKFDETTNKFDGYQRQINKSHKNMILEYLRTGMSSCGALMTDAITVALRQKVVDGSGKEYEPRFETTEGDKVVNAGHLVLPFIFKREGKKKVGLRDDSESLCWIVDGQHRLEAFLEFDYAGQYPVPFTFYKSSDVNFNREVFIRTNIRLPVRKDVLLRDLARITGAISSKHALDQLVGQIAEKLEFEIPGSPFADKIKR